jgi:hypothetical protein
MLAKGHESEIWKSQKGNYIIPLREKTETGV